MNMIKRLSNYNIMKNYKYNQQKTFMKKENNCKFLSFINLKGFN